MVQQSKTSAWFVSEQQVEKAVDEEWQRRIKTFERIRYVQDCK